MNFTDACIEASKRARELEEAQFVYEVERAWIVSSYLHRDWLFKAYPGGRSILSVKGSERIAADRLERAQ